MTFDRNPKPVQFIQPNVLHRACLSVGKDDSFAGQFRLRLTVLVQNLRGTALMALLVHVWPTYLRAQRRGFGQGSASGKIDVSAPPLAEPIESHSEIRR